MKGITSSTSMILTSFLSTRVFNRACVVCRNQVNDLLIEAEWRIHVRLNTNHHWFRQWLVACSAPSFISAKAGILVIEPIKKYNFSEISIEIYIFLFKKMHLKKSFGKWLPFCIGLNMLKQSTSGFSKTALWLLHSFKLIVMTSSPVNGPFSQIKQHTSPISQNTTLEQKCTIAGRYFYSYIFIYRHKLQRRNLNQSKMGCFGVLFNVTVLGVLEKWNYTQTIVWVISLKGVYLNTKPFLLVFSMVFI